MNKILHARFTQIPFPLNHLSYFHMSRNPSTLIPLIPSFLHLHYTDFQKLREIFYPIHLNSSGHDYTPCFKSQQGISHLKVDRINRNVSITRKTPKNLKSILYTKKNQISLKRLAVYAIISQTDITQSLFESSQNQTISTRPIYICIWIVSIIPK